MLRGSTPWFFVATFNKRSGEKLDLAIKCFH